MAYKESDDHVPDPTAHYGTLDTTGIYGGDHGDASKVSGIWDVARAQDLGAADFDDEEQYSDEDRDRLQGERDAVAERAELTGLPLAPNPVPEGTLHMDDVLTPEEQAQRLDPNAPDPLVERARAQGYDVSDDAYRGGATVSDGPALAPESDEEEPEAEEPAEDPRAQDDPEAVSSEPVEDTDEEPATEDEFDPTTHTVEEVNAYLTRDETTDEEADRVLAAERAGKNRKGIVGE